MDTNAKPARRAREPKPARVVLTITPDEIDGAIGIGRATVYTMMARGEFPQLRKLSPGRVGWLRSEIEEWLASRPVSDLLPPPSGSKHND